MSDPSDDPVARRSGHEAGERWLLDEASEPERAALAASFAGGGFALEVEPSVFPSLRDTLAEHTPPGVAVDFSSSPWLSGFREAVIAHLGEPG